MKNTKPTLTVYKQDIRKEYAELITIKSTIPKPKTTTASIKRAAKKSQNRRKHPNQRS
jgi:hypothetical protein